MRGGSLIVPGQDFSQLRCIPLAKGAHDGPVIIVCRSHIGRLGAVKRQPVQTLPLGEQGLQCLFRPAKSGDAAGKQMELAIGGLKPGAIPPAGCLLQTLQYAFQFTQ